MATVWSTRATNYPSGSAASFDASIENAEAEIRQAMSKQLGTSQGDGADCHDLLDDRGTLPEAAPRRAASGRNNKNNWRRRKQKC
jgi:hypothetical protein